MKDKILSGLASRSGQKGFTLAEMLVAIFIFSILIAGVAGFINTIFKSNKEEMSELDRINQATLLTADFVNELRNASIGNNGGYPLSQVSGSNIIFYSSFGATSPAVKRIRYYLSGGTLYKGVVVPTGNPLTYNLASEVVMPVQFNLTNNVSNPVFYYYDGDYDSNAAPLIEPININQAKFIEINLVILGTAGAHTISSGVAVRNLKTNLGN